MALTGNQNNVALFGQHAGGADSLAAINNAHNLLHLLLVETCQHIVDDIKYIIVKPFDFAYNPARVNIGSLGMNNFDFDGCVSPVYVVFRCDDNYQYFFDLFRQTDYFKKEVKTRAIGGVRQTLGYKDFSLIKVVYPPKVVVEQFNKNYSTLLSKKSKNDIEITRLGELRDILLPKLMSGELKVSEMNA